MFGLTKKDLETFVETAMSVAEWALEGFYPIVPDLNDEEFVNSLPGDCPKC